MLVLLSVIRVLMNIIGTAIFMSLWIIWQSVAAITYPIWRPMLGLWRILNRKGKADERK